MVLVFVFKLFALIEDQKGVIVIPGAGVIHASKLQEAGEVTSSNAVTRLKRVHPE